MITESYPNGLIATTGYDEAGAATGLSYDMTTNCSSNCHWLGFNATYSVHDQQRSVASDLSSQDYTYDAASRLVLVKDTPATLGCVTRAYGYDADSNRLSQTTRSPLPDGTCDMSSAGTVVTHTFDAADRVTSAGYVYDSFGRITNVPAPDAGAAAITATYFANDLVASLNQSGTTRTFTLDPVRRIRVWGDGTNQ